MDIEDISSAKLWKRVCGVNEIMEVAEELIPHFKPMMLSANGGKVRYVSVKTVYFDARIVGNAYHYDVESVYLTDQGEFRIPFIVREFREIKDLEEEIGAHQELKHRTSGFKDVWPAEILLRRNDLNIVVYEVPPGDSVFEMEFGYDIMDFVLGRICGAIQGGETESSPSEFSELLFDYLLGVYPFTDEERGALKKIVMPFFERLKKSRGGFTPCTMFEPKYLKMQFILPPWEVDKNAVMNGEGVLTFIQLNTVDPRTYDRMEDIATYYTKEAIDEFLKKGEITRTLKRLKNFFEGYREALKQHGVQSLEQLYPEGEIASFYFALTALIGTLPELQKKDVNDEVKRQITEDLLRFLYMCFIKRPFENLFFYAEALE